VGLATGYWAGVRNWLLVTGWVGGHVLRRWYGGSLCQGLCYDQC